jgi:cysteine desulfurase
LAAKVLYLDHNATTPVDPEVLAQMLPWFSGNFGNASSKTHAYGWEAAHAVKKARQQLADLIGSTAEQLSFTSGATESLNLVIRGLAESWQSKKKHLISWETEHKAVLDPLRRLEKQGFSLTLLPVQNDGSPNPEQLRAALRDDTLLVCGMLANNESGVIFPIRALADITHAAGAWFCCDATQAVGKISVDVGALGVDFLVGSAHKFYGPKGVGFLYQKTLQSGPKLQPLILGGGHENGLRSGTLNVPGIVGLGAAAALAKSVVIEAGQQQLDLRQILETTLTAKIEASRIMGDGPDRLPNTTLIYMAHTPASALIKLLRPYALATGSACSSAEATPSHVLLALGLNETEAGCCLRISTGRSTSAEALNGFAEDLIQAVAAVRADSPAWKYR